MQVIVIPAEYNPFHSGHAWQLQQLRQRYGKRAIVLALMSGPFCQRGLPALAPAEERAQAALACGLDLVLELPLPWAISSADYFAQGIVQIMAETGLRYTLACSAEIADPQALEAWAELRIHGGENYHSLIRSGQAEGLSYAAAEARAAARLLGLDPQLLSGSNNQLAGAYLAALGRHYASGSGARPDFCVLERQGQAYLDQDYRQASSSSEQAALLSARAIRRALEDSAGDPSTLLSTVEGQLPNASLARLLAWQQQGLLSSTEHYGRLVLSRLLTARPQDLASLWGWNLDLAQRLTHCAESLTAQLPQSSASQAFRQVLTAAQTRCFPLARIQRALLSLFLELSQEEAQTLLLAPPAYTRLLAANKNGRYLLSKLRRLSRIPIVTRASDRQNARQRANQASLQALEERARRLYSLLQVGPLLSTEPRASLTEQVQSRLSRTLPDESEAEDRQDF